MVLANLPKNIRVAKGLSLINLVKETRAAQQGLPTTVKKAVGKVAKQQAKLILSAKPDFGNSAIHLSKLRNLNIQTQQQVWRGRQQAVKRYQDFKISNMDPVTKFFYDVGQGGEQVIGGIGDALPDIGGGLKDIAIIGIAVIGGALLFGQVMK